MTRSVVAAASGLTEAAFAALTSARQDVMDKTEAAHWAALRPADPGGLSHGERAALAVRVCRRHKSATLTTHYQRLLDEADGEAADPSLTDPAAIPADPRLAALAHYADKAGAAPRTVVADDIEALKRAGIEDADIVRLSELVAFLAYQIRLVDGLSLIGERS
ncbi:MAG: hypothetical protein AAGD34_11355 [Pseudomonadota bacterium]